MRLVFIYGPVASGKLTIARELGALTGLSVFHNHLIVDAVTAIFPFGTDEFVRLREELWLTLIREAANANVSLIFTFAPEPTVSEGFPSSVRDVVESTGGNVSFVRLTVPEAEQEERLGAADRSQFGKLVRSMSCAACASSSEPARRKCQQPSLRSTLAGLRQARQRAKSQKY
jgi:hypothetical protein